MSGETNSTNNNTDMMTAILEAINNVKNELNSNINNSINAMQDQFNEKFNGLTSELKNELNNSNQAISEKLESVQAVRADSKTTAPELQAQSFHGQDHPDKHLVISRALHVTYSLTICQLFML